MKELQVLTEKFEGQNITFRLTENTSEVMIDDVAKFCGWNKVETRSGRKTESIRWKRVNEYLTELGFDHKCTKGEFYKMYT